MNTLKNLDESAEFSCPICMDILYKPLTFECTHTFCKICIDAMLIYEPNFVKCPICRRKFLRNQIRNFWNMDLDLKVFQKFSSEYLKRCLTNLKTFKKKNNNSKKITLIYGNTLKKVINNDEIQYEITIFVKMKNNIKKFVKKIEFDFFPHLGNDSIILRSPPFEIRRTEKKEFSLTLKIFWQKFLKYQNTILEYKVIFEDDFPKNYYFNLEYEEKK